MMPNTYQASQTPLPPGLEQAAVEQIAFWFQNRDHLGLKTFWPAGVACHACATMICSPPSSPS
jgi:hypothetical protein